MNNRAEKVCRLCSRTICHNDFDTIEEVTKQMLDVLFLKLNWEISKNPVMCNKCATVLQESFDFKSVYVDTTNGKSSCAKSMEVDLEEDCLKSDAIAELNTFEDQKSCQFCNKLSENGRLIQLLETKENMFIVDMLPKHFPELNFNITEDLVSCETCLDSLQKLYSFIMECLHVEEKMKSYKEMDDKKDENHIRKNNIQEFEFKPVLCGESGTSNRDIVVKAEIKNEESVDSIGLVTEIEEVNIKMEPEENEWLQDDDDTTSLRGESNNVHCSKLCSFESDSKSNVTRHMIVHDNPSDYSYTTPNKITHKLPLKVSYHKCDLCSYKSTNKKYLKSHMLTHTDLSEITIMHKCPMCPFATKRKDTLNNHKLTHKNCSEVAIYKCELCPYESKFRRNINRHMSKHKPQEIRAQKRTYMCETCGYETKYNSSLRKHMLTHKDRTEVTMYKCDGCPYQTRYKNYLKRHVHTSPYKCGKCSYETKTKFSLIKHLQTHAMSLAVYKCTKCLYDTKRESALWKHMLIHKKKKE